MSNGRETRDLTVTVDGEDRDATWKQGVGIYVDGHDFGKGDTLRIEGTAHEVTDMRRMQMHGEAVTLTEKASKPSEGEIVVGAEPASHQLTTRCATANQIGAEGEEV